MAKGLLVLLGVFALLMSLLIWAKSRPAQTAKVVQTQPSTSMFIPVGGILTEDRAPAA